ncbi:hypothetical protein ACFFSH_24175 [Streptomyces filamentosus]|uniref:hypothetical protein n=1 Tax=Streptomyces filamentosus TaxID=67294 RepID=UPI00167917EB|nr:hypothetical protein [Streptomyces filamentosus]
MIRETARVTPCTISLSETVPNARRSASRVSRTASRTCRGSIRPISHVPSATQASEWTAKPWS